MTNIYEDFHRYFEVMVADTPELLKEVFKIRYQVLCVEKRLPGFEWSQYLDEQERDDHDAHSVHVILKHKPTGRYIGTVRLILFDPRQPDKPFPIELHAQIDSQLFDINTLERQHTAEISRFVILGQFNRRRTERRNLEERRMKADNNVHPDRRSFPSLGLALVSGIVRMCKEHNIKNWLSVMDPALNRLLSYFGSDLNPIGPITDYHGLRRPYFIELEDVLVKMYQKNPQIWEVVTERGKYFYVPKQHEYDLKL